MNNRQRCITAFALTIAVFLTSLIASGARNASAAQAAASTQQPTTAQQSTLKAETRLVQVSVVVHDKSGAPVRDLKQDYFVVLD